MEVFICIKKEDSALWKKLPDNSIALFFSGKAPYKVGDEKYPFSVDRSYYWMTGLDKENMILLVGNIQGMTYEYLFIEPYDEETCKMGSEEEYCQKMHRIFLKSKKYTK